MRQFAAPILSDKCSGSVKDEYCLAVIDRLGKEPAAILVFDFDNP
jgi:hypothetical protein